MSTLMHQRLIDFGLSEKEARVYLALLELGPVTAQDVASHSGVNRTTIYLAIESLKKHGLVSGYEKDGRSMFTAESPKRLADLIGEEVRIAEEKQRLVSTFIPELLAMHRMERGKPVVRYFEGEEGIQSLRATLAETRTKQFDTFARLHEQLEAYLRSG
jgi:sugar-specific transcriptional regulator TrmB